MNEILRAFIDECTRFTFCFLISFSLSSSLNITFRTHSLCLSLSITFCTHPCSLTFSHFQALTLESRLEGSFQAFLKGLIACRAYCLLPSFSSTFCPPRQSVSHSLAAVHHPSFSCVSGFSLSLPADTDSSSAVTKVSCIPGVGHGTPPRSTTLGGTKRQGRRGILNTFAHASS